MAFPSESPLISDSCQSSSANSPRIENMDGPPGRRMDHRQFEEFLLEIEDASRMLDTFVKN